MLDGAALLEALPVAVYMTDEAGYITFYNEAAAKLWGRRPTLGTDRWCGSHRLFWPDGRPMPRDQSPLSAALRQGEAVEKAEAIVERPDGSRVLFVSYPSLMKDAAGRVTGAINLQVEVIERRESEIESAHLAAIVASSDDAIVSKSLDGQIRSWNAGAARIFGYEPHEMIGQPIKRIIPPELHEEEDEILAKLQRGERIDHFDTIRIAKDGRRVDISLTVSPLRDRAGNIIGASKVGRDVTERKRSEELQRLLLAELNHRVKNTLAMIQAIASQSLRRAASPADFVAGFNGRVQALARAHDLLVQKQMKGADLIEIVREQVVLGAADGARISYSGPVVELDGRTAVQFALVLHELATNARKHGALSGQTGKLQINWRIVDRGRKELLLEWRERGIPNLKPPQSTGFGTTLVERTADANGGKAAVRYGPDDLVWEISIPLPEPSVDRAIADAVPSGEEKFLESSAEASVLEGKRILVVEDEPLVALEIQFHLTSLGCQVLGPAGSVDAARELIRNSSCDAALLDANLGGSRVDGLATELQRRGIPFAFATGYGRESLAAEFPGALVVTKPFGSNELVAALESLLTGMHREAETNSSPPAAFRPAG